MPRHRPAALPAAVLALSAVVLSGCSAGMQAAQAGSGTSAATAATATTRTAAPAERIGDSPTPSAPDVTITDDYFADLERYWPGEDGIETALAVRMIEDVCDTSMEDGIGAGPSAGIDGFHGSGFYEGVRLQGEVHWALPMVVAQHHCPDRLEAVGTVQQSVEAGEDLTVRSGPAA